MPSTLADRMKEYEQVAQGRLARRVPVILRIDGKAFHTLTRGMDRPFDERLIKCMWETAVALCKEVQGCRLAYIQSDEISLLLTDWDRYESQSWFDYRVQKMVSVAAGIATAAFGRAFAREFAGTKFADRLPMFDARAANYPRHEVANYFVWRQLDWVRNSVHMLGRAHFSSKALHRKHAGIVKEMLREAGHPWEDLGPALQLGVCVIKSAGAPDLGVRPEWVLEPCLPEFTTPEGRQFIEKHLTDVFWKEEAPTSEDVE